MKKPLPEVIIDGVKYIPEKPASLPPVKPRVGTLFQVARNTNHVKGRHPCDSDIEAIELTPEVCARLGETAGVDWDKVFTLLLDEKSEGVKFRHIKAVIAAAAVPIPEGEE